MNADKYVSPKGCRMEAESPQPRGTSGADLQRTAGTVADVYSKAHSPKCIN